MNLPKIILGHINTSIFDIGFFHFSEQAQTELIKKIEEQRKRWPCEGHLGAENDIMRNNAIDSFIEKDAAF